MCNENLTSKGIPCKNYMRCYRCQKKIQIVTQVFQTDWALGVTNLVQGFSQGIPSTCAHKGFSTSALWMFGARKFFTIEDCPTCYRMLSSIPGLSLLEVSSMSLHPSLVTTKNVSRHCQVSTGEKGKNHPIWELMVLDWLTKKKEKRDKCLLILQCSWFYLLNILIFYFKIKYTIKYYSTQKMDNVGSFAVTRMDLESVILTSSEVSQKEKNKYFILIHKCRI